MHQRAKKVDRPNVSHPLGREDSAILAVLGSFWAPQNRNVGQKIDVKMHSNLAFIFASISDRFWADFGSPNRFPIGPNSFFFCWHVFSMSSLEVFRMLVCLICCRGQSCEYVIFEAEPSVLPFSFDSAGLQESIEKWRA